MWVHLTSMMMYTVGQARFGQLNDPLLQSERTRMEEDKTVMQCVTGERLSSSVLERLRRPVAPLARQTLSTKQMANVQIIDIDSPEHQKNR